MNVVEQKLCLNVQKSDLSGSKFDDVNFSGCDVENANMSGWRIHNANLAGLHVSNANLAGFSVSNARLDGATVDGIAITDLLAYWRAGHPEGGGMTDSHIAQLNIGRFRFATDDARMAGFMQNLDRVNALAERSEGFVWRLKDDSNNATAFRPFSRPRDGGEPFGVGKRRGAGKVRVEHGSRPLLQRQGGVVRQSDGSAFRHVDDSGRTHTDAGRGQGAA